MRHTFSSIYKDHLGLWVLDELMGHVHSGMTLGVYSHPLDSDMDGVVPILERELRKQYLRGKNGYLHSSALPINEDTQS